MIGWALATLVVVVLWVGVTRPWAPRRPMSAEYRAVTSPANEGWQARRHVAMLLTFGRDALCPWWAATEVDHLGYQRMGRELPWIDVVPLSHRTHAVVTVLRRMGLKWPVNAVLRVAYGTWIATEVYLLAVVLGAAGIVHGVPGPAAVAAAVRADALTASGYVRELVSRAATR